MKERLISIGLIGTVLLLTGLPSCSNSSTSNNKQNTNTNQSLTSTAAMTKTLCSRPLNVHLTQTDHQGKGNYILTYSWDLVDNATGYEFELLLNGNVALQNLIVTDTFLTFPQAIAATDSIKASVRTICGSEKSTSIKESSEIVYLNAVATDDVIFLVNPTSTIQDLCSRNCEKLKFTSGSMLNSDGSTLRLASFFMQIPYYDFEAIKDCIQCSQNGGAPLVDSIVFNNCLTNPLNQYWLYDPNAFTTCP